MAQRNVLAIKPRLPPQIGSAALPHQQYGALPVRRDAAGAWQVLLLTKRGRKLWGIPKGWPIRKLSGHGTAAQEAFEEAGVRGRIEATPIGRYTYIKRVDGSRQTLAVDVFVLHVDQQLPQWPEMAERATAWFTIDEAAARVEEAALADIVARLADPERLAGQRGAEQ